MCLKSLDDIVDFQKDCQRVMKDNISDFEERCQETLDGIHEAVYGSDEEEED